VNEELKIEEAQHFLEQLVRSAPRDPDTSRHNVSAFLSAARAALQYAFEESKSKPDGRAWYDAAVSRDPAVKFLKTEDAIALCRRYLDEVRRIVNEGRARGLLTP
jgi:hypothetical protein